MVRTVLRYLTLIVGSYFAGSAFTGGSGNIASVADSVSSRFNVTNKHLLYSALTVVGAFVFGRRFKKSI